MKKVDYLVTSPFPGLFRGTGAWDEVTVTTYAHRLERILDVVQQIRQANKQADHERAEQLNERLAAFLAGSPEKLLKTRELADWVGWASPARLRPPSGRGAADRCPVGAG